MCSVCGIDLLYDVDTEPDVGLYSVRVHGAGITLLAYGLAYGLAIRGSTSDRAKRFFSSPKRANGLRGPSSFISIPGGYSGRVVKLAIHLHLLPRLRISGARSLLLVYGVHRDAFTFT